MKLEAAIKKIRNRAKAVNRKVEIEERDRKTYVAFEDASHEISFYVNSDGTISSPHLRAWNDFTDSMTDYFAGYFVDNITQALNSVAPLPPKYPVGSLVRFKDNKRNNRWKLAGKLALVIQAEHGGNYKLQYEGNENPYGYDPLYSQRDLELVS